jgi:hypothetical protein
MRDFYLKVFFCLFSLKILICAILSPAMVHGNQAVLEGKILISEGGVGGKYPFLSKI